MLDSTQIHCFEPSIHTFRLLQDSYLKNHSQYKNIFLNNVGLGAKNATATLHYDAKGSGLASLTKRRLEHFNIDFNQSEEVKITTLDEYCKSHNITHIHLLKMDVEGHELDILHGAKDMFAQNAIDIATFEFGGCNIDTRTFFQDFWYFFKEQKMQLYRILPNGTLHKIPAYKELYEQFTTTNFVAIKER